MTEIQIVVTLYLNQLYSGIHDRCRIAIPHAANPFPQNQNPGITTTLATPLVYYSMNWDEHLDLRCRWRIEFNIVLNIISQP